MPKTVLIICLISLYSAVSGQNPFIDGIKSTEQVEFKDGEKKTNFMKFRINSKGKCSAEYAYTEMDFENRVERTFENTISWNWAGVASVEKDTVKNILRLNSHESMPSKRFELGSSGATEFPDNNTVNIYFKDTYQLNAAVEWVLSNVKSCGGKAILIQ